MSEDTCTPKNKIPRPAQLKGLHYQQTKFNLISAITLAGLAAYTASYILGKRRERYAQFYLDYDAETALARMNRAGLMQSGDNFER